MRLSVLYSYIFRCLSALSAVEKKKIISHGLHGSARMRGRRRCEDGKMGKCEDEKIRR
jgi:hypothetical protein